MIFGSIRKHLGAVFHDLARQKGVIIEEGHLMPDHVHMCLSIPPKLAVSNVVGFLKGKSAISIARTFKAKQSKETLMVTHFELGDILSQQLGLMKIWLGNISVIKKSKM
jgi:REP element-mobilizing transposase RayT